MRQLLPTRESTTTNETKMLIQRVASLLLLIVSEAQSYSLQTASPRSEYEYGGEIRLVREEILDVIKSPQPYEYIDDSQLPSSWDWKSLGMLTADLNQHVPQ